MNSKHSLVFFSTGIIIILGLVLLGIMPFNMNNSDIIITPESQQIIPINIELEPQLQENNPQNTILGENDNTNTKILKPVEEMNCTELNEFIFSFEKGWGAAIPLYDERCP